MSDLRRHPARPLWNVVAGIVWAGVLGALLARAAVHPLRPTSLTTYLTGGAAWRASEALYTNWRGFVYPPIAALFFSVFTYIPAAVAALLWRGVTAGVFLLGLGYLLRSGAFYRIPAALRGVVFLAVLPLSIGNLDNAQANPLIAGLMMVSVAAFQGEAWTLCAVAAGIATTVKIYPVALGLLLCLLRPRQLLWRYALVLVVLALVPFGAQDRHYVAGQYQAWIQSRMSDNRFEYPMKDAPLDLWYLLVRLGKLPVSERAYTALQAVGGIALAGLVWTRRREEPRDVLAILFLLVSVWMLLLGPATENQTYVVLGPAAGLLVVEAFSSRGSMAVRALAAAGFAFLLAGVARNSLTPHLKSPIFMAIQPVGALLLLGGILSGTAFRSPTPSSPR